MRFINLIPPCAQDIIRCHRLHIDLRRQSIILSTGAAMIAYSVDFLRGNYGLTKEALHLIFNYSWGYVKFAQAYILWPQSSSVNSQTVS